jgi:hypothetical protein
MMESTSDSEKVFEKRRFGDKFSAARRAERHVRRDRQVATGGRERSTWKKRYRQNGAGGMFVTTRTHTGAHRAEGENRS